MRAMLVLGALLLSACAGSSEWPPRESALPPQMAATPASFAYCPKAGSGVARRRVSDGAILPAIRYVQAGQSPPCVITLGGATNFMDALGVRTWPSNDGPRLAATLSRLFPLEVGKQVRIELTGEAQRYGDSHTWAFTFEVIRRERIRVPAGSYPAFVIRVTQQGMFNNTFLEERAVWLDEETWLPLRMQRRLIRGIDDAPPADWEATSLLRPSPLTGARVQ